MINDPPGFCLGWSFLYIYIKCNNPDVKTNDLIY